MNIKYPFEIAFCVGQGIDSVILYIVFMPIPQVDLRILYGIYVIYTFIYNILTFLYSIFIYL